MFIQLFVHGFGLHTALQSFGKLTEQRGFKLLESRVNAKQLF